MKICVIHPKVSYESAKELADKMGWDCINPFETGKRNFSEYLGVFNYGCNRNIVAQNVINPAKSVATCIDKIATFKVFKAAGVPTVNFTTNPLDTKAWDCVVIRDKVDGAKAEGLHYHYNDVRAPLNPPGPMRAGALYTEGFEHEYELRVVVFCGKVVGCYQKVDNNGQWDFVKRKYSLALEAHAKQAATALEIDYVGFDVLVDKKGVYVFLEANSGPVLTEEALEAIKGYIK